MNINPSDITVEVKIIRANGTEEILGTVGLFNQDDQNDNGTDEPSEK